MSPSNLFRYKRRNILMEHYRPRVLVAGTGAIGGFYGHGLAEGGARVSALCRSDYKKVERDGITIHSGERKSVLIPEKVYASPAEIRETPDYLVVSTKVFFSNSFVTSLAPAVGENTSIVLIQNGIDIEEQYRNEYPENEIISGLAFICATRRDHGIIDHLDYGRITIGTFPEGKSAKSEALAGIFRAGKIECRLSETIMTDRWIKLVWNAPFNPVSALTGGANTRDIMQNPMLRETVRDIMKEVHALAAADGHPFPESVIDRNLADTEKMTPYIPSMGIDYLKKQPMEVEAILGKAVRKAEKLGIEVRGMKFLYALLGELDRLNRG